MPPSCRGGRSAPALGCSAGDGDVSVSGDSRGGADDDLARVDRALYLMAAMTGLRLGELVALRWRDVDWTGDADPGRAACARSAAEHRSRALVAGGPDGRPRRRGARPVVQASAYQADDDLVFAHPRSGRPLDRGPRDQAVRALAKRAGDPRPVCSTTCATRSAPGWLAAACRMRTLQEWMGHADIKTTMVYMHFAPAEEEVQTASMGRSTHKPSLGANKGDKRRATSPIRTRETPVNPGFATRLYPVSLLGAGRSQVQILSPRLTLTTVLVLLGFSASATAPTRGTGNKRGTSPSYRENSLPRPMRHHWSGNASVARSAHVRSRFEDDLGIRRERDERWRPSRSAAGRSSSISAASAGGVVRAPAQSESVWGQLDEVGLTERRDDGVEVELREEGVVRDVSRCDDE